MPRFDGAAGQCALWHVNKALERIDEVFRYYRLYPDKGEAACSGQMLDVIRGDLKQASDALSKELDRCAARDPWVPPARDCDD